MIHDADRRPAAGAAGAGVSDAGAVLHLLPEHLLVNFIIERAVRDGAAVPGGADDRERDAGLDSSIANHRQAVSGVGTVRAVQPTEAVSAGVRRCGASMTAEEGELKFT